MKTGKIFTVFIGTPRGVRVSGNRREPISFSDFFSSALFLFSVFLPGVIKRFKNEERLANGGAR